MLVEKCHGSCRECGGQLRITEVEEDMMHVQCDDCGDAYEVETDAFGDGCMLYWFPLILKKKMGEEE